MANVALLRYDASFTLTLFEALLDTMAAKQPAIGIFENVKGLRRCFDQVKGRMLKALPN